MVKKINIAIVGATGLVGSTFLKVLEEKKNIRLNNVYLYASERSAGKKIHFRGKEYIVELLDERNILNKKIDYALFSAGGSISAKFAPIFVSIGAIVIDNSSNFRMDSNVPLVVPQVNMQDAYNNKGIIANPNCSTIQCMAPLDVLNRLFKIRRVHYVTFQAVSGSGMKGIEDLKKSERGEKCTFYPHSIYNNCLPHIDVFLENGYTKEEMKMVNETRKILGIDNLEVSATCVRVPVYNSHSIAIEVQCEKDVDLKRYRKALSRVENVEVCDDLKHNIYPLATLATGTDNIYVGRIRNGVDDTKTVHMFVVADNIRKGAASNAIEILEKMIKNKH